MSSKNIQSNTKEGREEKTDLLYAEKILQSIEESAGGCANVLLAFRNPFFFSKRFFFFNTLNFKKVERLFFELEVLFLILANSYLIGSNQESMIFLVSKLFGQRVGALYANNVGGIDKLSEIINFRISIYTSALNDFIVEGGNYDSLSFRVFSKHIARSLMQGLEPDEGFQYEVNLITRSALDLYPAHLLNHFGPEPESSKKPA